MKSVSLLFFAYEKKRIKNVPAVAAITFKNGVNKIVINVSVALIVALALLLKTSRYH
jgi:7-cyano-7-deazaguanine synthase in queuosine biosynthesis